MHYEQPIEVIVKVLDPYYLAYALLGQADKNVEEWYQDQNGGIDKHLVEREDHERLDDHWDGMMIHGDWMNVINVDCQA